VLLGDSLRIGWEPRWLVSFLLLKGRKVKLSDTGEDAAFRSGVHRRLEIHSGHVPQITAQPTAQQVASWCRRSALIAESGFADITWPAEAGGGARTYAELKAWYEERGRRCAPMSGVGSLLFTTMKELLSSFSLTDFVVTSTSVCGLPTRSEDEGPLQDCTNPYVRAAGSCR